MFGVREAAYNTLVRPQLEYAAAIWDPHTNVKTEQIEKVQWQAARWTTCNFDRMASVSAMLETWVAVPLPDYIKPNPRTSRRGHSMTFQQIHTGKDFYKYSFFPLAVVQWNALPESAISSPSLDIFKVEIGKLQHIKP